MLVRALSADVLKLKRTLAVWMTLIAPAVVVILQVLVVYFRPAFMARYPDAWMAFATHVAELWTVLMLTLFLTLETALVSNLEHAERHWKHLLSMPIQRWSVYISKFLIVLSLVISATLALIAFTIAGGVFLGFARPELHMQMLPPVGGILLLHAKAFLAAILAITLQHWVSLRWQSFTVAMSVGMSAMVIGFVIANSQRWGLWYPWAMPHRVMTAPSEIGMYVLLASAVGGVLALAGGCWSFSRQEIG